MAAKSPTAGHRSYTDSSGPLDAMLGANEQLLRLTQDYLRDSETWQVERASLLEERSRLRAMIDQVPDYLFVKDRASRFVIANMAVAADLGREWGSIIGKTDLELHPPEKATEFLEDES